MANEILTTSGRIEPPEPIAKPEPPRGADTRQWGYKANPDSPTGYDSRIFASAAEREAAGWKDTPHGMQKPEAQQQADEIAALERRLAKLKGEAEPARKKGKPS